MSQDRSARVTSRLGDTGASDAFDSLIGQLLRAGVIVSVMLLVAGVAWNLMSTGRLEVDAEIERMNLYEFVRSEIGQLVGGSIRPALLVNLGIAALLVTPYLRVVASVVYFAFVARDVKYSFFTAFVLAVLSYSLFLR
jgi:uncharacterized membrane protein